MSNGPTSLCIQDLSKLVHDAASSLPHNPSEQDLQGCAFDVRRALINKAVQNMTQEFEQDDSNENAHDFEHYEDILRKTLAPMQGPTLQRIPKTSAFRSALLAILGLLFGSAIGQGISAAHGLSSGLVVIFGILGVVAMLWLSEHILQAAQSGTITLPLGTYTYKRARKFSLILWFGVLALAVIRDFLGGRTALLHIFESLNLFLTTGNVLGIFTNIYGVLAFALGIGLLIKRPIVFDKEGFIKQLELASLNWWNGATLCSKLLIENELLKNNPAQKHWQQVGRDVYSFAHELPNAQKQWLTERLHKLGIKTLNEEHALTWHKQMLEHYIPLGHIDDGDACYVDEPPILEDNIVVRKGTMRKIR